MSRSSVYLDCMESWWKVLFLVIDGSIHFLFLFLYFLCVLCLRQTVKSSCHNKLQRVFSTAEGFCNLPFPNLSQRILLFFLFFLKQFQTFISSRPANILLWKFRFCSVLVQSIKRPCSTVLIEFLPYWQCTKACYWIFLFFLFFWNLGGIQQSHSMCQWNYCGLLRRYCSAMTATNILILHWIGCSLPTFFLAFSFLLAFVLLKGNEFRKVEVRK